MLYVRMQFCLCTMLQYIVIWVMLFSKLLIVSKLGSYNNNISVGDDGCIQICIEYVNIIFQASGLHNYALELIVKTHSGESSGEIPKLS